MRPGMNNKRPRGRHPGGSNGNGNGMSQGHNHQHGQHNQPNASPQNNQNRGRSAMSMRHQTFDSNGPDVRVRGTPFQVFEKYQSLARDAAANGDRVLSENYLQHAEHYHRIVDAINSAIAAEQARMQAQRPAGFGDQPELAPNGTHRPADSVPNASDAQQPLTDVNSLGQPSEVTVEVVKRGPKPLGEASTEPKTESGAPVTLN